MLGVRKVSKIDYGISQSLLHETDDAECGGRLQLHIFCHYRALVAVCITAVLCFSHPMCVPGKLFVVEGKYKKNFTIVGARLRDCNGISRQNCCSMTRLI